MTVNEKILALREQMLKNRIDAYIIPTGDDHCSEYIGDYFKAREFMSGFTGSAGTLIITMNESALWTDGRYFLQAQAQLKESEIKLMRMGEDGVPSIPKYLSSKLTKNSIVGFDGRTISATEVEEIIAETGIRVNGNLDLVGEMWKKRPEMKFESVWKLSKQYAGISYINKVSKIREELAQNGADILLLTSLDEIAWLLNIRGNDIHCNPVFMSFMVITKDSATLFAKQSAFDKDIIQILSDDGVEFKDYDDFYAYIEKIPQTAKLWLDKNTANYRIVSLIKNIDIIDRFTPALYMKAVKNEVEIENMKKAHIMDGVAVTKFIYWLKNNVGKENMSEISIADKLEEFRKESETYLAPSFDTIVGYADHGAVIHYSATKETNYGITPENFVLIDSGGHYLEGTTDITRTIALGPVSDEQKKMYTAVLCGNLKLADANFLSGCTGVTLDYLARESLWKLGYDYRHGTGHGVGYLLNVHEGPYAFRYAIRKKAEENAILEPGVIISDEPGVYIEGEYGIRLENLILCVGKKTSECGRFLGFETLTYVPFDVDAINVDDMTAYEISLLRAYHAEVYEKISPYLNNCEKEWLHKVCNAI